MTSADSRLFPSPRNITYSDGYLPLRSSLDLEMPAAWRGRTAPEISALASAITPLEPGATRVKVIQGVVPASSFDEAYCLTVAGDSVLLTANAAAGARFGLRTLMKLIDDGRLPCCEIQDWPTIPLRGIQFDLGRVIERPEVIEGLIPLYAQMNYNVIQLYLENAFVFPSHPKLARPFAWTLEQAMKVVDRAASYGMTVIPAIQVLGHCHWLTSHPEYRDLDERRASGGSGVLCPSLDRTGEVINGMIQDVAPLATSGIIHLGMDESPVLGQCELCRPIREEAGEGGVFAMHANNVAAMAKAAGKRPAIWGDMFHYFPGSVALLDKDIIVFDWYYYTFDEFPRIDIFDNRPYDSVSMLQQQGIESWGCPSSFYTSMMPYCLPDESINNCRDWTGYISSKGEKGVMVTQWELTPSTIDMALPVEGAMAGFLWGDEIDTPSGELLRKSCAALYGRPELAPLLEEMGEHRFHGHCARRWLYAPDITQMITYEDPEGDLALAERFQSLAGAISSMAIGSKHPEMVTSFAPASLWLAYQYRKRAYINKAVSLACDGRYSEAADLIRRLMDDSSELAGRWEAQWLRNRYKGDFMTIPEKMREERRIFAGEKSALDEAAATGNYSGGLTRPVLAVHIVDTFGACCMAGVGISRDGVEFKKLDGAWVLQFDSEAMGGRRAAKLNYTFPLDDIEGARFVRIKVVGTGRFSLRGITLHQGKRLWGIKSVASYGLVEHGEKLLSGGLAVLGCPDSKQLFLEQAAAGDSGGAFSKEHGFITVELDIAHLSHRE